MTNPWKTFFRNVILIFPLELGITVSIIENSSCNWQECLNKDSSIKITLISFEIHDKQDSDGFDRGTSRRKFFIVWPKYD